MSNSEAGRGPRVALIGSGLAGSVLAKLLDPYCRITLFERGDPSGAAPDDIALSGHQTGMHPFFYYAVGGTTRLWAGGMLEMLPKEFGPQWPDHIRTALPTYYPAVVKQLYGSEAAEGWTKRVPTPLSDNATLTSIYYSAPADVPRFALLDGFAVNSGCKVLSLKEVGTEVEIEYEHAGTRETTRTDFAIVSAGGMNSPILLQRSGLGGSAVGRNFTEHPAGFVAKVSNAGATEIFKALRTPGYQAARSNALIKIQDPVSGLWSAIYLRGAMHGGLRFDPYTSGCKVLAHRTKARRILAAATQIHNLDFIYQAVEERYKLSIPSAYAYVLVINEQEATGQGEITLDAEGRAQRNWRVSPTVSEAIKRNLHYLKDILACDLRSIDGPLDKRLYASAHVSGGCRIAETPDKGVVDTNLRVHGSERIYVCDGSVLPSTGASNTGLTIGSLSHRLAAHLRELF